MKSLALSPRKIKHVGEKEKKEKNYIHVVLKYVPIGIQQI